MSLKSSFDAYGNALPKAQDRLSTRTRSLTEPVDSGISRVEFDALVAEVSALKAQIALLKISNGNAVTRDVTKSRGNGNALTPAEKQRRYRERLKNKN
jgi:hypothetical protein